MPAQQEPEGKPRKQPKISSWRDWFVKTESGAMVVGAGPLLEGATPRRKQSTDTAEVKLLKDKFKALVYGRNKDPATLLFKKFDPDGDGELSFPEFQEAVRRNWKASHAPLTKSQITKLFKMVDTDGSGEIDMVELAEFVWGVGAPEALRAKILMDTGRIGQPSPKAAAEEKKKKKGEMPALGVQYLRAADVAPEADGPPPDFAETMALRAKLKEASYNRGGQDPGELFKKFDRDGSNELDLGEFIHAVRKGGKMSVEDMSDRECRRLFRLIDADGSGEISIEELVTYVWGEGGLKKDKKKKEAPPMQKATVRQSFFGEDDKHLAVTRGDIVTVQERMGVWCSVREQQTGRTGLVPTAYISMPPKPGQKKPTKNSVARRLYKTKARKEEVDPLSSSAPSTVGNRGYWRTVAVPMEAHVAAARQGLFIPEVLQGAREFFHMQPDLANKLTQPRPAGPKKLSELAAPNPLKTVTPRGSGAEGVVPHPPKGPKAGGPLSARTRTPRRLASLRKRGAQSERDRRQEPRHFGAETYVNAGGGAQSLRQQAIERSVGQHRPVGAQQQSAVALAAQLSEHDAAEAAARSQRRKQQEDDAWQAQWETQLEAAKKEVHSARLLAEHENARQAAKAAKHAAFEAAEAKRKRAREEEVERREQVRLEHNKLRAAYAQAQEDEKILQREQAEEERLAAREEVNAHIAQASARGRRQRNVFARQPQAWRSLKANEKRFLNVKAQAGEVIEAELEKARSEGPMRLRKLGALQEEFTLAPAMRGEYPRHTWPQLCLALDTAKGDLRSAIAWLTEFGPALWAAETLQAAFRGRRTRIEINRQRRAATKIQARQRGKRDRKYAAVYKKNTMAAKRIQARQRGLSQRKKLLEQHTAAIRIQAAERRRQGMRLRIDMYVWRLQQLCRRHLVRQEYAEKRRHATMVQKHFRGWRARQILKMLHEDVGVFVAKKKVAAHEDSDEKSRKVRLATLSLALKLCLLSLCTLS